MALTIVSLPVEKGIVAYNIALAEARKADHRIAESVSDPKYITDKVRQFAQDVRRHFKGTFDDFTAFLRESIQYRLIYDGAQAVGGYLVLDGELLGLFCTVRGKGDWLMRHAVLDGANRLDCFAEPALLKLYHRHGFTIYRSEANWDPKGLPVVFMGLVY